MNKMSKTIGVIVAISLLIGIVYAAADLQNLEKPIKKVQPVVKLKTLNAKITNNTDGEIEIFVNNPSQNALNIDVKVIGNVYFFGKIFHLDGVIGTGGTNFIVLPGQQITEDIMVRSDYLGTYPVQIFIEYYTESNIDVRPQKISFKDTFKVTEKGHKVLDGKFLK